MQPVCCVVWLTAPQGPAMGVFWVCGWGWVGGFQLRVAFMFSSSCEALWDALIMHGKLYINKVLMDWLIYCGISRGKTSWSQVRVLSNAAECAFARPAVCLFSWRSRAGPCPNWGLCNGWWRLSVPWGEGGKRTKREAVADPNQGFCAAAGFLSLTCDSFCILYRLHRTKLKLLTFNSSPNSRLGHCSLLCCTLAERDGNNWRWR